MNIFKKIAIVAAAIIATAIVPVSGAFAQTHKAPAHHHAYKAGPDHYKNGPRVHYPRGYYKKRPPVVVKKSRGNAAAAGILGFAAGALVGNALAR